VCYSKTAADSSNGGEVDAEPSSLLQIRKAATGWRHPIHDPSVVARQVRIMADDNVNRVHAIISHPIFARTVFGRARGFPARPMDGQVAWKSLL